MEPTHAANQPAPQYSSHTGAPVPPAAIPPQVVYLPAQPGPFRRWFSWLGWVGCILAVTALIGLSGKYRDYFDTTGGIHEKFHSGQKFAKQKIAIIDVSGIIGASDEFVKHQIDRIRNDQNIKAVVVRVDSPGGTITGSDYIYHHLLELKKDRQLPLVVSMGSIAASGGYYIAMAVGDQPRSIFAEPTTTTGSIGVIIPHYDFSGLLADLNIVDDSVVSHPRKQLLSMTRPIRPEDRGVLEAYLQDAFTRFKDVIKAGRPTLCEEDEQKLTALATGEIFTARQAQEHGLVDELGFIEDAVARAAELASLPDDSYRVVTYKAPLGVLDLFQGVSGKAKPALNWQSLLEASTPKAYYLASTLPAWTQLSLRD
jgi:protease-4